MSLSETTLSPLDWEEQRLGLVWADESSYPKGLRGKGLSIYPFRIWHLRSGSVRVVYRTLTLVGKAGDWLILPEQAQEQTLAPGTSLLTLALDCRGEHSVLRRLAPQRLATVPPPMVVAATELVSWAKHHATPSTNAVQMPFAPVTAAAFSQLQAALCSLLGSLLALSSTGSAGSRTTPLDPRLRRLLSIFEAHAQGPFPDKTSLVRLTGLGWRRIEQLCREGLDESPGQIHDSYRIRAAMHELDRPELPIKQIAKSLGFLRADRFSHWFKRHTRLSPTDSRLRQRL